MIGFGCWVGAQMVVKKASPSVMSTKQMTQEYGTCLATVGMGPKMGTPWGGRLTLKRGELYDAPAPGLKTGSLDVNCEIGT